MAKKSCLIFKDQSVTLNFELLVKKYFRKYNFDCFFNCCFKRLLKICLILLGNAAGLLARRGLMMGGRGETRQYSDTDTDSDTEEYVSNAHK